jgi:L-alanine-DL-glutamate epimerase-like enolase superfamily enzyme
MFTNEKPGGHGERSVAIGTIDMAIWDAVAKIEGKPLFQLLADRYGNGTANRRVFVYAAGGYYYPGKDDAKLKDEMRSYLDRGYNVVKMKIGGASLGDDLRRIDSVLSILQDGQRLAVDANGRFDLDTAIAYAKALSPYNLFLVRRGRATRWTMSCRPRCATTTPTPWPRAKTCSRCRTHAT